EPGDDPVSIDEQGSPRRRREERESRQVARHLEDERARSAQLHDRNALARRGPQLDASVLVLQGQFEPDKELFPHEHDVAPDVHQREGVSRPGPEDQLRLARGPYGGPADPPQDFAALGVAGPPVEHARDDVARDDAEGVESSRERALRLPAGLNDHHPRGASGQERLGASRKERRCVEETALRRRVHRPGRRWLRARRRARARKRRHGHGDGLWRHRGEIGRRLATHPGRWQRLRERAPWRRTPKSPRRAAELQRVPGSGLGRRGLGEREPKLASVELGERGLGHVANALCDLRGLRVGRWRHQRSAELGHFAGHRGSIALLECDLRLLELAEFLEGQTEIRPGALMLRIDLDDAAECAPRWLGLAGLDVTERQVDLHGDVDRKLRGEGLVDPDGGRVEAESEVDGAEQVLTLRVERLHRQRLLERLLGLEDAVVLKELAPAIEVKEKVFLHHVASRVCRIARRHRAGLEGERTRIAQTDDAAAAIARTTNPAGPVPAASAKRTSSKPPPVTGPVVHVQAVFAAHAIHAPRSRSQIAPRATPRSASRAVMKLTLPSAPNRAAAAARPHATRVAPNGRRRVARMTTPRSKSSSRTAPSAATNRPTIRTPSDGSPGTTTAARLASATPTTAAALPNPRPAPIAARWPIAAHVGGGPRRSLHAIPIRPAPHSATAAWAAAMAVAFRSNTAAASC